MKLFLDSLAFFYGEPFVDEEIVSNSFVNAYAISLKSSSTPDLLLALTSKNGEFMDLANSSPSCFLTTYEILS